MKKKGLSGVFLWLFIGLLITFVTGYVVSLNANMVYNIFSGITRYILMIATLGIAIFLGARIWKMNKTTATCLYLLYTFLTGLTLSSIFIVYELSFIFMVFLVAACLFGGFAIIGKVLKVDLSKISTFLIMGLIGVIILSIVNVFLHNGPLEILISCASLVVFLGYTAYDIQKISRMTAAQLDDRKVAIIGAFSLYIDYINIVMDLISLFGGGNRRD